LHEAGKPSMKVAVLGLGYVGSVTAACLADRGHTVVGVDPDEWKVGAIRDGRSPIVEPGLAELVQRTTAAGTLDATTDAHAALDGSVASLVCVGTPSRGNGSLDLSFVERVAEQIGVWLRAALGFHVVVVRSTVLPGTVERTVAPMLERASGRKAGTDFGVAMCPEFLREATAVPDFYDPPFTVVGTGDQRSADLARELFGFLAHRPYHEVGIADAEAIKYACNAFHAVKVAFANEVARFSSSAGVDTRRVMDVFVDDDRLNLSSTYLRPGFAFGGSCLPKDLRALLYAARTADQDLPMLSSVLPSNELHIREAARAVLASGARCVALLGLSFKSGTDDLRESPYVELAETLLGKGVDLRIYDAEVNPTRVFGANRAYMEQHLPHLSRILHADPASALEGVQCAVVATAEGPVVEALRATPPGLLLDVCGLLPADIEAVAGFRGLAW